MEDAPHPFGAQEVIALIGQGEQNSFIPGWISALETRGVNYQWYKEISVDLLESLGGCKGVMTHFSHRRPDFLIYSPVMDLIEKGLKIPVFPNRLMRVLFDRKDLQSMLLRRYGFPTVKTYAMTDYAEFVRFIPGADFPIVMKAVNGASSSSVIIAYNIAEAKKYARAVSSRHPLRNDPWTRPLHRRVLRHARSLALSMYDLLSNHRRLEKMHHLCLWQEADDSEKLPIIYWQEFMAGNDWDTRVTVIGDRAFCFRRRNRPNDFRASGSGLIEYQEAGGDTDAVQLAFAVEKALGLENVAFDFLRDARGKPRIIEISYGYVSRAVRGCPGYWTRDGVWERRHMVPEELHVELFLKKVGL